MKTAAAYKVKEEIFLQGYAQTTDGLSMLYGPVLNSSIDDYKTLGKNVLLCLDEAGQIIPHPQQSEWAKVDKESLILKETKMKSFKALMKNSMLVGIILNQKITFTPYHLRNTSGSNRGYDRLEEKAIIWENLDDYEGLGRALLEAFERCE